jgi:hypothetical protein
VRPPKLLSGRSGCALIASASAGTVSRRIRTNPSKRPDAIVSFHRPAGTPANTSVSPWFVGITPAALVAP